MWSVPCDFLLQDVNAKEYIWRSTILVKLRPTDPLQTTVARLHEEVPPCIISLVMLATVMFVSRTWSPGKNTIVVLEVKYSSASCAYSESIAQWLLWGQDEHEVAVGVTQYTFSAEQQERVLISSAATRTMNDAGCTILSWNGCKRGSEISVGDITKWNSFKSNLLFTSEKISFFS